MTNLKIFGTHQDNTIEQMNTCLAATEGTIGVLCADGHKGYSQPIGGVIAYPEHISISGVGFDIACGNLAIKTDARASDVLPHIEKVMDDVFSQISFGVGRVNNLEIEDHPLFESASWDFMPPDSKDMARKQFGTVGSGNHYVDVFVDDADDSIWVGVHFGSRGLGHKTATMYLEKAGGKDSMDAPPALAHVISYLAIDYLQAMHLAGEYAYAGREFVARHVVKKILGANILDEVHNHHNFAWLEKHDGVRYWVVRKGATPAFPGQRGFVGGSMGDNAVILEGVDSPEAREALFSTVHGAGRVMSRTQAKGRFEKDTSGKKQRREGLVRHDEMMRWLHEKGVTLRGADLDEAPQAYRRLPEVLAAHEGTIRILNVLRPIGVAMAGRDIKDPYKD